MRHTIRKFRTSCLDQSTVHGPVNQRSPEGGRGIVQLLVANLVGHVLVTRTIYRAGIYNASARWVPSPPSQSLDLASFKVPTYSEPGRFDRSPPPPPGRVRSPSFSQVRAPTNPKFGPTSPSSSLFSSSPLRLLPVPPPNPSAVSGIPLSILPLASRDLLDDALFFLCLVYRRRCPPYVA